MGDGITSLGMTRFVACSSPGGSARVGCLVLSLPWSAYVCGDQINRLELVKDYIHALTQSV